MGAMLQKEPSWRASPVAVATERLLSYSDRWVDSVTHFLRFRFLTTFLNVKMQFFI